MTEQKIEAFIGRGAVSLLKYVGVFAAGSICCAVGGKIGGELIELTPYVNDVARYVLDYFSIQADTGDAFAFSGCVIGPAWFQYHLKEYALLKEKELAEAKRLEQTLDSIDRRLETERKS